MHYRNLVIAPLPEVRFDSTQNLKEKESYWREMNRFIEKYDDITEEYAIELLEACSGHFQIADKLAAAQGDLSKLSLATRDLIYTKDEDDRLMEGDYGMHSKESAIDRLEFLGYGVYVDE